MEIRRGIGVSAGYAIGEALVLDREEYRISRRTITVAEVDGEIERFRRGVESAVAEIRSQIASMSKRVREEAGSILEAQITMLQNPHFAEEIAAEIRKNQHTADHAVSRTIRRKIKAMEDSGHEAFYKRVVSDLTEFEKCLMRPMVGESRVETPQLSGKAIVVAHDLSPSQTIKLDRTKVLGILTEVGGLTSHTAIVAKSLGIPAVVGVDSVARDVASGDQLILDGTTGTVIVAPDEGTRKRYQAMERNYLLIEQRRAKELQDLPAVTTDGTRVEIFANIESPEEIPAALAHGAEGIGLYRTEFLYLGNHFNPSEKDHQDAYNRAVTLLGNRRIIIRTLDLGADKMPHEGAFDREANPFLGTRAIRLCFQRPDMFKTQIRAILRAASRGNVEMMIPMISSLSEVRLAKEVVEEVRRELRSQEEPAGDGMKVGIMIEIPSAAVVADMLAPHVDFFSVGTNDLIAYSVAVDRANERVASLYQPAHPAVLRLLKLVFDAGAKAGKSVSVCGEMSSDINFTLLLLGLGLRNFSVVPFIIPDLKKLIRSVSILEAQAVAEKALTFDDSAACLEYLKSETQRFLPDTA
ncbi:MAG TPA: phosphoenolpyruvate--protein phosphotransferase [Planctomycetota bacterium]|nr:phosphoenolpyruvate--protein phosphotransferase [Planctomycetota bacterium]